MDSYVVDIDSLAQQINKSDIKLKPSLLTEINSQKSIEKIKSVVSADTIKLLEQYVKQAKKDIKSRDITDFFAKYKTPIIVEHLTFTAIEGLDLSTIKSILENQDIIDYISEHTSFMTHALTFGNLDIVNCFLEIPAMLTFIQAKPAMALSNALYSGKSQIIERILQIDTVINYVKDKYNGVIISIANIVSSPADYDKCCHIINTVLSQAEAHKQLPSHR